MGRFQLTGILMRWRTSFSSIALGAPAMRIAATNAAIAIASLRIPSQARSPEAEMFQSASASAATAQADHAIRRNARNFQRKPTTRLMAQVTILIATQH